MGKQQNTLPNRDKAGWESTHRKRSYKCVPQSPYKQGTSLVVSGETTKEGGCITIEDNSLPVKIKELYLNGICKLQILVKYHNQQT